MALVVPFFSGPSFVHRTAFPLKLRFLQAILLGRLQQIHTPLIVKNGVQVVYQHGRASILQRNKDSAAVELSDIPYSKSRLLV